MKSVCLFFQVHQPLRHRRYRFFDIGNDHYYYDDYANETVIRRLSDRCYLPANDLLLKLADKLEGRFKVAFSISGLTLEQFEIYAPEVIESFQKLAKTGCVEFLSETYSHSLSSLSGKEVFQNQVKLHNQRINELFGQEPRIFRNTEMIYSDEIGLRVSEMGFQGMLAEGAKHILGWKSPNFLYVNALNPRLKILFRNFKLSDDISFRFSNNNWSEYPLTADKYIRWLENIDHREEIINLFLNYESIGDRQTKETGIFEFLDDLAVKIVSNDKLRFATPSEAIEELQPVSTVNVSHPVSWADEERDVTAWLGNEMQKEAFNKLYSLGKQMERCFNTKLKKDWNYLQVSDHFNYMSTKFHSHGHTHTPVNPFDSPYEAFINYMNVLSDFKIRLNSFVPENEKENEIAALHKIIDDKENKIRKLEADLHRLQKNRRKPVNKGNPGKKQK